MAGGSLPFYPKSRARTKHQEKISSLRRFVYNSTNRILTKFLDRAMGTTECVALAATLLAIDDSHQAFDDNHQAGRFLGCLQATYRDSRAGMERATLSGKGAVPRAFEEDSTSEDSTCEAMPPAPYLLQKKTTPASEASNSKVNSSVPEEKLRRKPIINSSRHESVWSSTHVVALRVRLQLNQHTLANAAHRGTANLLYCRPASKYNYTLPTQPSAVAPGNQASNDQEAAIASELSTCRHHLSACYLLQVVKEALDLVASTDEESGEKPVDKYHYGGSSTFAGTQPPNWQSSSYGQ